MTNHAIIGQAFSILREQLAPYVVQKIMQIPDYKGNDLWWTEGIMSMLSDRERSVLYYGDDFAQRVDSLDVAACLNLIDRHWGNLFKYILPNAARSWAKEANGIAHKEYARER